MRGVKVGDNSSYGVSNVEKDSHLDDSQLKYKLRSINLIKQNPNLFTNRNGGFLYMWGGEKTILATLGLGAVGLLYRKKVNTFRGISHREGVWFNTMYFLFGASIGLLYSTFFFARWQVIANEYFAFFLIKRFKGSNEINRRNIYHLRDEENNDECYRFSNSYANSFHT